MAYVYRYTDRADGIIKYVGIVWSDNRTLAQRIKEHSTNDDWCKGRDWKIEYLEEDINTRTDAEYMEAHYISLYSTHKYYNIKKAGWGVSSFIPLRDNWQTYGVCEDEIQKLKLIIEELNRRLIQAESKLSQTEDKLSTASDESATYKRAIQLMADRSSVKNVLRDELVREIVTPIVIKEKHWTFIYRTNSLYLEGESHKNTSNNDINTVSDPRRDSLFMYRPSINNLRTLSLPVKVILYIDGKKSSIRFFDSIKECSQFLEISHSYISNSMNCVSPIFSKHGKYLTFDAGDTLFYPYSSLRGYGIPKKYALQFCAITPLTPPIMREQKRAVTQEMIDKAIKDHVELL